MLPNVWIQFCQKLHIFQTQNSNYVTDAIVSPQSAVCYYIVDIWHQHSIVCVLLGQWTACCGVEIRDERITSQLRKPPPGHSKSFRYQPVCNQNVELHTQTVTQIHLTWLDLRLYMNNPVRMTLWVGVWKKYSAHVHLTVLMDGSHHGAHGGSICVRSPVLCMLTLNITLYILTLSRY